MAAPPQARDDVVWVPDPVYVYSLAKIISVNGNSTFSLQALVSNDKLACINLRTSIVNIFTFGVDDVLQYDASHELGVHDLGVMNNLNNAAVLNTISTRFFRGSIYTAMHPLFISVNPYQDIPDLYNVRRYEMLISEEKDAHLFTMIKRSIDNVMEKNQSIIVRGESGAGKTEACKRILAYIISPERSSSILLIPSASPSSKPKSNAFIAELNEIGDQINKKLIACNPVLEAFGNAKTLRNDNSSRFGKYLKVMFDQLCPAEQPKSPTKTSPGGSFRSQLQLKLQGAVMQHYLLERSRVVYQAVGERNYHVFYQLLCGCSKDESLKATLGLESDSYSYICEGSLDLNSVYDLESFSALCKALQDIGIQENVRLDIYKLLACILHLGNLSFKVDPDNEWASVCDRDCASYRFAEEMLGIADLACNLTTKSVSSARGRQSVIMVNYTVEKAIANAAAVAKEVYDRLFNWLVVQCNATLNCVSKLHYVGILDLFGFEVFKVNSFEQLCINYCNEKLQGLFNELLFENEVRIYQEEGIYMDCHNFDGNKNCLELFENDTGIFKIIDGQCALGRSQQSPTEDGKALLKQLELYNSKNEHFSCHPSSIKSVFFVHHFAGKVEYDLTLFTTKNTDKLEGDLEKILMLSDNELLSDIFSLNFESEATTAAEPVPHPGHGHGHGQGNSTVLFAAVDSTGSSVNTPSRPSSSAAVTRRQTMTNRKKQNQTVGSKFRMSVKALMAEFNNTQVQYLKCIKPNDSKRASELHAGLVYQQLKYSGILEVVRIRQSGFPLRETWTTVHRFLVKNYLYMCVLPGAWQRTDRISMMVDGLNEEHYARQYLYKILPRDKWFEGKTKLFFKQDAFISLLSFHKAYCAKMIQRRFRGFSGRKLIWRMLKAFRRLLQLYRIWRQRKQLAMAKWGMTLLCIRLKFRIALRKMRIQQKWEYYQYLLHRWRVNIRLRKRRAVNMIVSLVRRPHWRRKLRCLVRLVLYLQAWQRGKCAYKQYQYRRWAIRRIQRFWRRVVRICKFVDIVYAAKLFAKRMAISTLLRGVMNMYRNSVLRRMKSDLFAAARMNDVATLMDYLSPSADSIVLRRAIGGKSHVVSLRDSTIGFASLLHVAAEAGSKEFVHALLAAGADACAADDSGLTALHRVIVHGDEMIDMVEAIVRAGVEVLSVRDMEGNTPLALLDKLINEDKAFLLRSAQVRARILEVYNELTSRPAHGQAKFGQLSTEQKIGSRTISPMSVGSSDVSHRRAAALEVRVESPLSFVSDSALRRASVSPKEFEIDNMQERRSTPPLSRSTSPLSVTSRSSANQVRKLSIASASVRLSPVPVPQSPTPFSVQELGTTEANIQTREENNANPNGVCVSDSSADVPKVKLYTPLHVSAAFERHVVSIDNALTGLMEEMQELSDSDGDESDELQVLMMSAHYRQYTPITNKLLARQQQRQNPFGSIAFHGSPISSIPLSADAYSSTSTQKKASSQRKSKANAALLNSLLRPGPVRMPTRKARKTEYQERAAVFEDFKRRQEDLMMLEAQGESEQDGNSDSEVDDNYAESSLYSDAPMPRHPLQSLFAKSAQSAPLPKQAAIRELMTSQSAELVGRDSFLPLSLPLSAIGTQQSTSPTAVRALSPETAHPHRPSVIASVPTVSVRSSSLGCNIAKLPMAYKNEYGEWVVPCDCFGRSYSPSQERIVQAYSPTAFADNLSVDGIAAAEGSAEKAVHPIRADSLGGMLQRHYLNEKAKSRSSAEPVAINEEIGPREDVGDIKNSVPLRVILQQQIEQQEKVLISRFQPARHSDQQSLLNSQASQNSNGKKARQSSVLQKRFKEVFDSDAQSMPSIFEHFKEYIDPNGEFEFDKIIALESTEDVDMNELDQATSCTDINRRQSIVAPPLQMPPMSPVHREEGLAGYYTSSDEEVSEAPSVVMEQFNYTEEDLAPALPAFEPDPEKRRQQRREKILKERLETAASVVTLSKTKPVPTDVLRQHNAEAMKTDHEYRKLVASHHAARIDPFRSYLAIPTTAQAASNTITANRKTGVGTHASVRPSSSSLPSSLSFGSVKSKLPANMALQTGSVDRPLQQVLHGQAKQHQSRQATATATHPTARRAPPTQSRPLPTPPPTKQKIRS